MVGEPLEPLVLERRARAVGKGRHPVYRVARVLVLGVGALAILALPVIAMLAMWYPQLSGAAYLALVNINFVLLGVVVLFMLRRLLVMFLDRRGRLKTGRLHVRLLGIFSILAVVPTVLVAVVAVYLLNLGIESWFSGKVNRAVCRWVRPIWRRMSGVWCWNCKPWCKCPCCMTNRGCWTVPCCGSGCGCRWTNVGWMIWC